MVIHAPPVQEDVFRRTWAIRTRIRLGHLPGVSKKGIKLSESGFEVMH